MLSRTEIVVLLENLLSDITTEDYASIIATLISMEVREDLVVSASPDGCWNDDDLKLAIGRALCKKLGNPV